MHYHVTRIALLFVMFSGGSTTLVAQDATVAESVDFATHVAPILQERCVECHNKDLQMADLRLDEPAAAFESGVLASGDAENSLFLQRLQDRELGILMPPSGRLPRQDIEVLERWIRTGATWPPGMALGRSVANKGDISPLFDIVRNGSVSDLAKQLNHTSDTDARDRFGATPLMYAAMYASPGHVEHLLDSGADPNTTDHAGLNALMYGAGADLAVTRLLLQHGAHVTTQSKLGRTALLMASAYAGNTEVVRALLESGANVEFADRRGWTAVVLAARTGDVRLVETLLDAGGKVSGQRSDRRSPGTPLMQAAWANDVATAKLLLARGAGEQQGSLDAALISAATHGSLTLVKLLLDAGADPHANVVTNYIPESPILAACGSDAMNKDVVQALLARNVDVHLRDNRGETPLSLAAQRGASEIVDLLRGAGAEDLKEDGKSPKRAAAHGPPDVDSVKQLAQRSVALLQPCGPKFFANSGCTACHQQTVTSLVVPLAKSKGMQIEAATERQQIKLTAFDLGRKRNEFLQRIKAGGTAHRLGYLLWGLAAAEYPPDEITDIIYLEIAGLQLLDGSWVSDAHRPPTEYSPFSATAVSLNALQRFSPPGRREQTATRVARATQWLATAQPKANAEFAFRLLGLAWGRAAPAILEEASHDLLAQQDSSGGWAQLPSMEPDAYATGLTLFALAESKTLPVRSAAYKKGVSFLVHTSEDDGSWHVPTRSFAFQPYFESGFPHGMDQWISAAATGWATLALLHSLEPTDVAD